MRLHGKILATAAALAVAGALVLACCPRPGLYGDTRFSTAVLDRDGQLLRLGLAADERYRLRLELQDIAPAMLDATLLYEDRHFRHHPGINPVALVRAAWSTYVARSRVIGASTITMQLARLRFDLDTRRPVGKAMQMARALQLERHYSKDQILEAYLNLAPYGGNIEGVGAAALIYFDKAASRLTMPEAMALAVVPQHPAQRNPASLSGHEQMLQARQRLMVQWTRIHDMTGDQEQQFELPLHVRGAHELPFSAAHFSANLINAASGDGRVLTSTLHLPLQRTLEQRISDYVQRRTLQGINNASAMLVDYRSMEVLATVGSADFFNDAIAGQVDGTRAKRSPGSTLKPFAYGIAMDRGLIHPMTMLKDAPKRFSAYTPENFDRGFMGPVFAKDALVYSRNVPAIQLLSDIGLNDFHHFLSDAGVSALKNPEYYGLAMILGGNELTMHELVRLYAMLANGGESKPLQLMLHETPAVEPRRLLSAESSYLLLDMLQANPRPGAVALTPRHRQLPVAWKTGTSFAFRDAWAVGVVGPYVLAVWVGNFDGSGNPAFVGRTAAAPLFFAIADSLMANLKQTERSTHPPPSLNLRAVEVCATTGDLPGRHCPSTTRSWFIPGVSPITVSDVHRAVRIDKTTGLRTCNFDSATSYEAVFEFWPSDIDAVFRKAGIALRKPPRWSPECSPDMQAASGRAPHIVSPSSGVTYHVRPERIESERVAFQATTDGDVQSLYWFVNDRFIAKVAHDEPLLWPPRAGRYNVVAVDDAGRSHSRTLTVMLAQ